MGVGLEQYRACIGIFNSLGLKIEHRVVCVRSAFLLVVHKFCQILKTFSKLFSGTNFTKLHYFFTLFKFSLLILSWDIELNLGPREFANTLSLCQWNLNSVWVEDFLKIAEITAFLALTLLTLSVSVKRS